MKTMNMPKHTQKLIFTSILLVNTALITSCKNSTDGKTSFVREPSITNRIATLSRPQPDSRGIISYDTYQIIVASGEETIAEIADRLDFSGEKLALYNGLIPNYRPRKNEVIAVPKADFTFSSNWSTEITRETIESEPDSNIKISSANDPLRHRVKTGETVYSIARAYNVSVNSIATWNGLGPDLEIKTGREIIQKYKI